MQFRHSRTPLLLLTLHHRSTISSQTAAQVAALSWTFIKQPTYLTNRPWESAYEVLEGMFVSNETLCAPLGTRVNIFNWPEGTTSWGQKTNDDWYVGLAPNHYQCAEYFIPKTGSCQILG